MKMNSSLIDLLLIFLDKFLWTAVCRKPWEKRPFDNAFRIVRGESSECKNQQIGVIPANQLVDEYNWSMGNNYVLF